MGVITEGPLLKGEYSPWRLEVFRNGGWWLAANFFPDRDMSEYLNALKDYVKRNRENTFRLHNAETEDVIMGDIL